MRRRRRTQGPRPDMTPMIDVTFLLLVFFIVTLNFRVLEGRLDTALPKDRGTGDGPADEIDRIDVRVLVADPGRLVPDPETKELYVWQDRRLRFEVGAHRFATLDELRSFLSEWPDRDTDVSIDPAAGTVTGDVMPVLDLLLIEGFESVAFSGTFVQDW